MGKRGPKPKGKVNIKWSSDFAYAIGLIVADGNLSKDGRHIDLTSKDIEQLENFNRSLKISTKISKKRSGSNNYGYRVQFSDVLFYRFLISIGLGPNKSLTIRNVKIPERLFFDFLRGVYDGDGCSYAYFDKRWQKSYMIYTSFVSGSYDFITWLHDEIKKKIDVTGSLTKRKNPKSTYYEIKFAKNDSLKIFKKLYKNKNTIFLSRKYLKIKRFLYILHE